MTITRALALFLALALLGFVLLALAAPAARAADPVIVRVTTSGTTTWPCGDQSNWSNPCALQTAFANAAYGDEVWVAAGIYTPTMGFTRTVTFQLRDGIALYGGFAGGETVRTQRNFTANVTILSGDIGIQGNASDNAYHVVTGSGVTSTAVLDGFTVMDGNANSSSPHNRGGGMLNSGGSPSLSNVVFSSNAAAQSGGGMYNSQSSPTLTNVTFISNTAYTGGGMVNSGSNPSLAIATFISNTAYTGGGMVNGGSSPSLTNVTFVANTARGSGGGMMNGNSSPTLTNVAFSSDSAIYDGGGMYNGQNSSPTLMNVTFSGNSSRSGGGMYNEGSSPTVTNVTFSTNLATVYGGAMANDNSIPKLTNITFFGNRARSGGGMMNGNSSPTLANVTFISNTADLTGGGMYNWASGPTLTNVTFFSNSATESGGGMYGYYDSNARLTNVTFSSNSATLGGGIYNDQSGPTLANVTLFGNSAAESGGGMYDYNKSSPTVRNAIFWGNTASSGSQIYDSDSMPGLYDSVVEDDCPYSSSACTNVITADPRLGALGDWGGSTQTLPLLPGSSAINAGNDATCATSDQRNKPRVGACDIGAFESQGFALTKTSGDNQSALVNTPFAATLGVNVSSPFGEPVNGGVMTFTAPSSGASAIPVTSAVTITAGAAWQPITANDTLGSYTVTAHTAGATALVTFNLTNTGLLDYLPLIRK